MGTMTYLVALAFVAIIGSLVVALIHMMRGGKPSGPGARPGGNMARALAFRVGFSILLFAVILLSYWMGWIQPTGIASGR